MAEQNKLLPCPFCGGEANILRFPRCERKYVVICKDENCMASVGIYSVTKETAIEKWNKRDSMERIVEQLEEEKQRLKAIKNDCIALCDGEVIAIEEKAYNFAISCVRNGGKK